MILLLIITAFAQNDFSESSTIHQLNPTKFKELGVGNQDSKLGVNDKSWFILFYRPTCGHCQLVMPIWEAFSDEYQDKISKIGSVNWYIVSNAYDELCGRFQISGVPTMILISETGHLVHFEEERVKENFYCFMKSNYQITENGQPQRLNWQPFLLVIIGLLIICLVYVSCNKGPSQQQIQRQVEMHQVEAQQLIEA